MMYRKPNNRIEHAEYNITNYSWSHSTSDRHGIIQARGGPSKVANRSDADDRECIGIRYRDGVRSDSLVD